MATESFKPDEEEIIDAVEMPDGTYEASFVALTEKVAEVKQLLEQEPTEGWKEEVTSKWTVIKDFFLLHPSAPYVGMIGAVITGIVFANTSGEGHDTKALASFGVSIGFVLDGLSRLVDSRYDRYKDRHVSDL